MEGGITEILLEYGSLGLFAAFLVWQHLSMQKRFDALVDKFQTQLEKLRGEQKDDIEEMRERYDKVIASYNDERTAIRVNLAEKISQVASQINKIPFDAIQIQIESVSLAQRNSHLLIEKGMESIKKMEEEAKLRDMARKLTKADEG